MKTVFAYKWMRDEADAQVRADGSIDWRNAKMTPGEDDPTALLSAKAIAAGGGGSVVGLTIGDGDASWALARGVEETVSVTDAPNLNDNSATAAIIAAGVQQIGDADVVVIGDSQQNPGVAAALAGHLGWPALVGLISATVADGQLQAVRKVGSDLETVAVPTPVVLGISAEADDDTKPGMKDVLAARKRPVTKVTTAELGVELADVESQGSEKREAKSVRLFEGDPATAAAELVAALRDEGVL